MSRRCRTVHCLPPAANKRKDGASQCVGKTPFPISIKRRAILTHTAMAGSLLYVISSVRVFLAGVFLIEGRCGAGILNSRLGEAIGRGTTKFFDHFFNRRRHAAWSFESVLATLASASVADICIACTQPACLPAVPVLDGMRVRVRPRPWGNLSQSSPSVLPSFFCLAALATSAFSVHDAQRKPLPLLTLFALPLSFSLRVLSLCPRLPSHF